MPINSFITPLYNKGAYIRSTLESVIAQTVEDWELIVVDNQSTDSGPSLVKAFSDARIRLTSCEKRGPAAARNHGLAQARGDWLIFLDADDLITPDHLQRQLAVAADHPRATLVACSWREFVSDPKQLTSPSDPSGLGTNREDLIDSAIAFCPWAPHAAMVRRSIVRPPYLWPEELDRFLAEDLAFWFKLLSTADVAYGRHATALYRREALNKRNQDRDPLKWFCGIHEVVKHNLRFSERHGIALTPSQCENLFRLYLSIRELADEKNAPAIARACTREGQRWLDRYFALTDQPKSSLLAFKYFGAARVFSWVRTNRSRLAARLQRRQPESSISAPIA